MANTKAPEQKKFTYDDFKYDKTFEYDDFEYDKQFEYGDFNYDKQFKYDDFNYNKTFQYDDFKYDKTFQYDDFKYDKFNYADYAESDAVKQANALLQQQMANKPGAYQSKWQGQIADYMNQIQNREPFSYDFNQDALYQQYRDNYIQQGQMAMMDTMGQAAAMTGGYGNSYAQSVGQQAYNQHLNQLNDVIPQLSQMAHDRYAYEGQQLLDKYNMVMEQENMDYGRYQNDLGNWFNELQYLTGRYDSERNFDYGKYQDNRNQAYNEYTADRNLAYDQYSTDKNLAYNQFADDKNLAYDQYSANKNLAYNEFTADRQMAYDQHNANRDLAYNEFTADRQMAYDQYNTNKNLAYNEFTAGRDMAYDQYNANRDLAYNEFTAGRDMAYDQYNANRDLAYNEFTADRQMAYDQYSTDKNLAYDQFNVGQDREWEQYLNDLNRDQQAAELMAASGDYSRLAQVYGLSDAEVNAIKAANAPKYTGDPGDPGTKYKTPTDENLKNFERDLERGLFSPEELASDYAYRYGLDPAYMLAYAQRLAEEGAGGIIQPPIVSEPLLAPQRDINATNRSKTHLEGKPLYYTSGIHYTK
jgi:hypothetical protein